VAAIATITLTASSEARRRDLERTVMGSLFHEQRSSGYGSRTPWI
jgi:hypothetical protein